MQTVMYDPLTHMGDHGQNQFQYFSPPREITALPLYCLDAGAVYSPPGGEYPVNAVHHPMPYHNVARRGRRLPEYQLVLIREGGGTFQGEGIPVHAVAAGTVLILPPGWWHRYVPDTLTGWHEFWVGFDGPLAEQLLRTLRLSAGPLVIPSGPERTEVDQLAERILRVAIRPGILEHLQLAALIQELLVVVRRGTLGDGGGSSSDPRFERARDEMIRGIRRQVRMPRVEESAGCSRATLQRLFRERTGLSPYRYFLSIKVDAVSWVLVNTDRTLKEVAREYGFTDEYHLSRVFRDIRGVPPGAWRERRRRKEPQAAGGKERQPPQ